MKTIPHEPLLLLSFSLSLSNSPSLSPVVAIRSGWLPRVCFGGWTARGGLQKCGGRKTDRDRQVRSKANQEFVCRRRCQCEPTCQECRCKTHKHCDLIPLSSLSSSCPRGGVTSMATAVAAATTTTTMMMMTKMTAGSTVGNTSPQSWQAPSPLQLEKTPHSRRCHYAHLLCQ